MFSSCSPARSSVLSGRLPPHVNGLLQEPTISNANDTESGWQGIPRSMTGIAAMLKQANYSTACVGKWDAGMATPDHTPKGRGFDTSLVYFHHENDYYTRQSGGCATNAPHATAVGDKPSSHHACVDLWQNDGPASALNASAGSTYEEALFMGEALRVINNHPAGAAPLFLYYASHIAHQPYEVPPDYLAKFAFIDVEERRLYHAMVNYLDFVVGQVVGALKQRGMWDNLVMVMSTV